MAVLQNIVLCRALTTLAARNVNLLTARTLKFNLMFVQCIQLRTCVSITAKRLQGNTFRAFVFDLKL